MTRIDTASRSLDADIALVETLRFAVPDLVNELLAVPHPERSRQALRWATDGGAGVGERGDLLIFRASTTWHPGRANAFNRLARGLAAAVVLHPDGIHVAGLHWCLRADCTRCRPPRTPPTMTPAQMAAELERLDADYRRLNNLPAWEPPPAPPPAARPVPRPRPRPVTTITTQHGAL